MSKELCDCWVCRKGRTNYVNAPGKANGPGGGVELCGMCQRTPECRDHPMNLALYYEDLPDPVEV